MEKDKLHFAFFGTPDVASRTLDILFECGYVPSVIITSPDSRSGRGMHLLPTPTSIWADAHTIPCLKPEKIDIAFVQEFKKYSVDLSIVVAYGKILPELLINMPRLGTLNIHYSLLPLYRGATPVEQALRNGDVLTGVSVQQMKFKLDTGDILAQEEMPIYSDDTKLSLRSKLINMGGTMLCKVLPDIANQTILKKEQDESKATYCTKIKKEDGLIDPDGNALENYNKYRAFEGWPGIYFFIIKNGRKIRVKITKARYENDSFIIERVIPEGRKEIQYSEFVKFNI